MEESMGDMTDGRKAKQKPNTDEDLRKKIVDLVKNNSNTNRKKKISRHKNDEESVSLIASDDIEMQELQNAGANYAPPPNSAQSESGTIETDMEFEEKIVVQLDLDQLSRPPSNNANENDKEYLKTELWRAKEELEKKTLKYDLFLSFLSL